MGMKPTIQLSCRDDSVLRLSTLDEEHADGSAVPSLPPPADLSTAVGSQLLSVQPESLPTSSLAHPASPSQSEEPHKAAAKKQLRERIETMRKEANHELPFAEWHGMSSLYEDIKSCVGVIPGNKVNGWAVLALVVGVNVIADRLVGNINTISVICGLLLPASLAIIYAPPAALSSNPEFDFQLCFLSLMTASICSHFACIILGSLYVNALYTAARDVDRWRLILHQGMLPAITHALFTLGNFFLALGMTTALSASFGWWAVAFGIPLCFFCGFCMHIFNSRYMLCYSHVVHGWLRYFPEQFQMEIPLRKLQILMEYDLLHRDGMKRAWEVSSPSKQFGLF